MDRATQLAEIRNLSPGRPSKGGGNLHARRMLSFRAAVYRAITVEAVTEIAQSVIDKAKSGNLEAAKLVLAYAVGPPEICIAVRHAENPGDSLPQQVQNILAISLKAELALDAQHLGAAP